MIDLNKLELIITGTVLVDYSPGYRLGEFDCGVENYNEWLRHDAEIYVVNGFCRVKLLISKINADIIAYMALSADSFLVSQEEKDQYRYAFSTIPALKIGQLASSIAYRGKKVGSYMLYLALGIADSVNEAGGACRFITVDSDEANNPGVTKFYEDFGFVRNEHKKLANRINPSLRYDIFEE